MMNLIHISRPSILFVFLLTLLAISSTARGSCTTKNDCIYSFYHCCRKANFGLGDCKTNCVGESCDTKEDCASDEICRNGKCRNEPHDGECDSDSDCSGINNHCCQKSGVSNNVCSSNCLGFTCTFSSDCGPNEHCRGDGICIVKPSDGDCDSDADCVTDSYYSSKEYCCERIFSDDNICAINCIFDSCDVDSNCAPDECCEDGQCTSVCNTNLAGWVIAVIIVSILITIAIPATIIICCYCGIWAATRRPQQQGVVYTTTQPNQTTLLTTQTTQNQQAVAQPHPQQPPPTYPATQYPQTQQPYPPSNAADPATQQPYPPSTYPATQQYPPAQQPYPPVSQGNPATQQYPPTQQPYPPSTQANPTTQSYPPGYMQTQQGYPAAQQPYPQDPPPGYTQSPYPTQVPDPNKV